MKLNRPPKRQHPETIVALIDVVFFLMVFFMMIGRMDATAPFEVIPPLGFTGADMPAGGLTISISEDGILALDGNAIAHADLAAAITKRLEAEPALLIRINADKAAKLRNILPLVGEIEQLGARDVVLVVTPNPV